MCHLGEWRGHTGDGALTATLLRDFTLVQRVDVPNWTDTAHELTVWRRRGVIAGVHERPEQHGIAEAAGDTPNSTNRDSASVRNGDGAADGSLMHAPDNHSSSAAAVRDQREPLQCWSCGGVSHAQTAGSGFRRCQYCRCVAFCGAKCAAEGREVHRQAHALRLIFFRTYEPAFSSDVDYQPVPTLRAAR